MFNENLCEKKGFFWSCKQCMEPTEKAFQSQNALKKKKKKKKRRGKRLPFLLYPNPASTEFRKVTLALTSH